MKTAPSFSYHHFQLHQERMKNPEFARWWSMYAIISTLEHDKDLKKRIKECKKEFAEICNFVLRQCQERAN